MLWLAAVIVVLVISAVLFAVIGLALKIVDAIARKHGI